MLLIHSDKEYHVTIMRKVTAFYFCSFKSLFKDLIVKIWHLKYANLKYAAIIATSTKKSL